MEELSLYILDITMNSVRAGATDIEITLNETDEQIEFSVKDNGCGMTKEQLDKLSNPFFTTRKTRKVGLGIPFLKMLAEMTGGSLSIDSIHESIGENHGTHLVATFGKNHIDFIPMGDIVETLKTLIQGSPDINFTFCHKIKEKEILLSCSQLKDILGDISLAEPQILDWIDGYLREQYSVV